MRRRTAPAFLIACLLLTAVPVSGDTLVTATQRDLNKIVQVNLTTDTLKTLCTTGIARPDSLLVHFAGGKTHYIYSGDLREVRMCTPPDANTACTGPFDATGCDVRLGFISGNGEFQDMVKDPVSVAGYPDGSFLVSDQDTSTDGRGGIWRVDLAGINAPSQLVPRSSCMRPQGLAYDGQGRLYAFCFFGDSANGGIYEFNPVTGALVRSNTGFDPTGTLDGMIFDPKFDPSGRIFGTSECGGIIYAIDPVDLGATPLPNSAMPVGANCGQAPLGPDGIITAGYGSLFIASRATATGDPAGPGAVYTYNASAANPTLNTGPALQDTAVPTIDDLGVPDALPPVPVKRFSAHTIRINQSATMTLTLTNNNLTYDILNVVLTDTLPAEIQIPVAGDGRTGGCLSLPGANLVVNGGASSSFTLTIPRLAAGSSCTLTLNVIGAAVTTAPRPQTCSPFPADLGLNAAQNKVTVTSDNAGGGDAFDCITITDQPNPPLLEKTFALHSVQVNDQTVMTIKVTNPNAVKLTNVVVDDTLPVPIETSGTPSATCGTAVATPGKVTLTIAELAAGASCTMTVNVIGKTQMTAYSCTVTPPPSGLGTTAVDNVATATSNETAPSVPAKDCITVTPPSTYPLPPTLEKQFILSQVKPNQNSHLSFKLCNPNPGVRLDGVNFTDTLPSPVTIASPNNLRDGAPVAWPALPACAVTPVAQPNTALISISGVTLAANACCGFQVDVFSSVEGTFPNTTSKIKSSTITSPPEGNAASAIFRVVDLVVENDAYQVSYAANLDIGDSYVDVTSAGTRDGRDPAGTICVNVYVFDPAEEPVSCCTCPVTPNGLKSLSVQDDLIANPLTPSVPTAVVIKLLASVPVNGSCNAASANTDNLVRGMRAWRTTLHEMPTTPPSWQPTEVPFSISQLSPSELNKLRATCGFIQSYGSGYGICRSCRAGGLGADKLP